MSHFENLPPNPTRLQIKELVVHTEIPDDLTKHQEAFYEALTFFDIFKDDTSPLIHVTEESRTRAEMDNTFDVIQHFMTTFTVVGTSIKPIIQGPLSVAMVSFNLLVYYYLQELFVLRYLYQHNLKELPKNVIYAKSIFNQREKVVALRALPSPIEYYFLKTETFKNLKKKKHQTFHLSIPPQTFL